MQVTYSPNRREIVILTMASIALALVVSAVMNYLEGQEVVQSFYGTADEASVSMEVLMGPGKFVILAFILASVSILKSIRGMTFGRFYSRLTMTIGFIAICLALFFPVLVSITLRSLF